MAKLLQEIRVTVFGDTRELHFTSTEDIIRWLDAEQPNWQKGHSSISSPQLSQIWDEQIRCFSGIRTHVNQFDAYTAQNNKDAANQNLAILNQHFAQLVQGTVLTSDHAHYPVIAELIESDLEAAAYVLTTARSDGEQRLKEWLRNERLPIHVLGRLVLSRGKTKKSADWRAPQRKELGQLKSDYQAKLNELRATFDEQTEAITEQHRQEGAAHEQRQSDWGQWKKDLSEEWVKLKKVYDEQLALEAPTHYWSQRADAHRSTAIKFAIAFGFVLTGGVTTFVCWAMPGLLNAAGNKDASVLLTLAPLLVPVFASIWVLKILSRLLSENLQLMRDARERETMVKTFLALMRDDQSGKALVQDNDRILILHALFRPSSLSAVDDAPPVHWFDILTNKVSSK